MRARDQMNDSIVSSRVVVEIVFIRYMKIKLSENIFLEEEREILDITYEPFLNLGELELKFIPCKSSSLTYWSKEIINK